MIAHVDTDAFFASVLQRRHPRLRKQPLLALGMGGGCVIAASYEAKAFGVKTGMPLREARKLCPEAIAVPSDFSAALVASREIESILRDEGPAIEQASVDEWYIDIAKVPQAKTLDLPAWAHDLQATVQRKTHLTVSIGVAPTKLLAKMASEYRKPAGVTLVMLGGSVLLPYLGVAAFLQDRPAAAIPGIGRRRVRQTDERGWYTAWDIAQADGETLLQLFGRPGLELQAELRGRSVWAVTAETEPPQSVSRCRSFRGTADRAVLFSHLLDHLTYTTLKMRRQALACTMLSVWLRDHEYHHEAANSKLPQPAWNQEQLLPVLRHCFEACRQNGKRYTQVGLALSGLRPWPSLQYSLFEEQRRTEAGEQIQQALDAVHNRFGRNALLRGSALPTRGGRRKNVYSLEESATTSLDDLRRAPRNPRS